MLETSAMFQVFKLEYSLERRKQESERIRLKYPDRVPVICERDPRSDIPNIDRKKYLVPGDLTVAQFTFVIRKRLKLPPERGMFLFVKGACPQKSHLMSALYEDAKDADGFLYVSYAGENVFGISRS